MQLRWAINLLEDGSVVTEDGEYLGTWYTDQTDAFHHFVPDGVEESLFLHPFVPFLCDMIKEWHEAMQTGAHAEILANPC